MPQGPDFDLVLASTSPYRRALLDRLGIPFRCADPGVDESAVKGLGLPPRATAERLADAKATALARAFPDATLIGSDQVVSFAGRILGKPGTVENAVDQLAAMAGKHHQLITALAVRHRGAVTRHTDVTTLWMRPLDRAALARVVEADRPLDCAGGYMLEKRGITLFERIDSPDQTAIIGLPLIALTTILRQLGLPIP